eukprot:TRINITY_DN2975_c0_g1_i1.p2 TRINITY_DN2975_c0_g1~~TRINITY_DN2975_c0_g1_i1.p2  ORF type:complete len:144 (+),score=44.27 TRINITY_DN2975_c0_g1_i1:288-719(+)
MGHPQGLPRTMFLKYGKKGSPHRRHLSLEPRWDGKKVEVMLVWQGLFEDQANGVVCMEELEAVEVGPGAGGRKFQRHLLDRDHIVGRKGQVHDSGQCLTLQFARRSLDLLALSRADLDLWASRCRSALEAKTNPDPTFFFVTI